MDALLRKATFSKLFVQIESADLEGDFIGNECQLCLQIGNTELEWDIIGNKCQLGTNG